MALIKCSECGKQISDKAKTCPNCGNPIEAIRMAEIDKQNREYYRNYNKNQLWINIGCFLLAMFAGYEVLSGELTLFGIVSVVVCIVGFLLMSVWWVQWVVAIFIASQRYKHIPKWMFIVTMLFGYAIGALIGLKS